MDEPQMPRLYPKAPSARFDRYTKLKLDSTSHLQISTQQSHIHIIKSELHLFRTLHTNAAPGSVLV